MPERTETYEQFRRWLHDEHGEVAGIVLRFVRHPEPHPYEIRGAGRNNWAEQLNADAAWAKANRR